MRTRQRRSFLFNPHPRAGAWAYADVPGLEDVLALLYATGQRAWPTVPLTCASGASCRREAARAWTRATHSLRYTVPVVTR